MSHAAPHISAISNMVTHSGAAGSLKKAKFGNAS